MRYLNICLCLLGWASLAAAQDRVPVVDQLRIGVVDLAKVFDGYAKREVKEAELKEEEARLQAKFEERKENLTRLRGEMDLLREGTEAYELKEEEVAIAVNVLQFYDKRRRNTLKTMFEAFILEILEEIEVVVKEIGEKNQYHFIVKVDSQPSTNEGATPLEFRALLYFSEEIDISAEVLEILNARYERAGND